MKEFDKPAVAFSLPPIWLEISLHSPSLNVTGVSFPGVPLVVIGHNESIAWGETNSAADVHSRGNRGHVPIF